MKNYSGYSYRARLAASKIVFLMVAYWDLVPILYI